MVRDEYEFGAPKIVDKTSPKEAGTHLERGTRQIGSAQFGVSIKF
jgi:hypothetical protein